MTKQIEYFYRFDSEHLIDANDIAIRLSKYEVTKHTQKGVWIEYGFEKDKFILEKARKHFACSTISEAKLSFLARKRRQLELLEAQAEDTRLVLADGPALMDRIGQQHGEKR